MTIKTTSQLIKPEQPAMPSVVKHLASSFVLASLLIGCASTDKQGGNASTEADSVVAAPSEPVQQEPTTVESKDVEQDLAEKAEANADAMMASLVVKSKFDEPKQAVKTEPVAKKEKPTESNVTPLPKVKEPEPQIAENVETLKVAVKKTEETIKEAEVKAVPEKVAPSVNAKPLNASLSDLPIEYDIWKIRKGETTLDQDLVISTPTWDMGESEYLSQIWLTIMDDKLLVNSSSDIYAPEGQTGIKLNGGELVPFDRIVEHNIGVLEGEHWLGLLAAGGEIEIFMGFFPDRTPKSGIYKSNLELDSLGRVAATYKVLK